MKDEAFIRGKVPMTKEEVRILTLDRLALTEAKVLIDVGAGTGSIGIEACMRNPELHTIAIEKNPEGVALIRQNCDKFSVKNLQIIEGFAPVVVPVEKVDAIFIGGSGGNLLEIIRWSDKLLISGGRLVMNFILLDNLMEALAILKEESFEQIDVSQLQVSRLTGLGQGVYFKPNNPTYIISCVKGEAK